MHNKRTMTLLFLLSLLITAFIWHNSFQPRDVSSAHSGLIMQMLRPLLDPQGRIPEEIFHKWVRKAAHFIEFAALGLSVGGWCACLGETHRRRYCALPVLIVLSVAVLDEYIQFFSDRGSMATDVILDFLGAMTGLALVTLGGFIRNHPSGGRPCSRF